MVNLVPIGWKNGQPQRLSSGDKLDKSFIQPSTTADIADSTDKRYVTEAEKTKLSNLSGTNTGDQNSSSVLLSSALPAPLASETTVQGALSAIAPLLGGSSSESVIYEFTQSGLSPSIGKQIRPTSSGWVNAQGNTIGNATNVWTIIAFSGDDIVACKVGRVNVPSHGLGSNNTLLYLSPTSAGGLTSTKPVGTNSNFLGFFLPVIFIEDANTIHVLGKSYPEETNLLARHVVAGTTYSLPVSNFSMNALQNKLRFEMSLQFATTGTNLYWYVDNSRNPKTRMEALDTGSNSPRSLTTSLNLYLSEASPGTQMSISSEWRKTEASGYYRIRSRLSRWSTSFVECFQSFDLSSGSDITLISLVSSVSYIPPSVVEVYSD